MQNQRGRLGLYRWAGRYPFPNWILDLLPPVSMVAEKIIVIPGVQHGFQEHAHNFEMPHIAETPVSSVDASRDDAEPAPGNFFAEKVVFRIKRAFIETAQAVKSALLKKHEHAGAEWVDQDRT